MLVTDNLLMLDWRILITEHCVGVSFQQDQDAHDKIKELRRIAFDSDGSGGQDSTTKRQLGAFAKDYKKLGFKCDINPALDFTETPPGMLALDCMIYFARNHMESYTKVFKWLGLTKFLIITLL